MLTNYILVNVNGKPINCLPEMTLSDLLLYLNFNISTIIVEHNKKIVKQINLHNTHLHANDTIEVLTIVGGG